MVGEDSLYCDELLCNLSTYLFKNNNKEFTTGECACQSIEHNNYVDFYIIESETSIKKRDSKPKQNLKVKSFYGRKSFIG